MSGADDHAARRPPAQGAVDGRRGARHGLAGSAPSRARPFVKPLRPAFDFERRDCRSGRGLSHRPPPSPSRLCVPTRCRRVPVPAVPDQLELPAAALQLGESDTTRSAGDGLSSRPARRRPALEIAVAPIRPCGRSRAWSESRAFCYDSGRRGRDDVLVNLFRRGWRARAGVEQVLLESTGGAVWVVGSRRQCSGPSFWPWAFRLRVGIPPRDQARPKASPCTSTPITAATTTCSAATMRTWMACVGPAWQQTIRRVVVAGIIVSLP